MMVDFASYFIRYTIVEAIWNKSPVSRKKWFSAMDTETFQMLCDNIGMNADYFKKEVLKHKGTDKPRPLVYHALDHQ